MEILEGENTDDRETACNSCYISGNTDGRMTGGVGMMMMTKEDESNDAHHFVT